MEESTVLRQFRKSGTSFILNDCIYGKNLEEIIKVIFFRSEIIDHSLNFAIILMKILKIDKKKEVFKRYQRYLRGHLVCFSVLCSLEISNYLLHFLILALNCVHQQMNIQLLLRLIGFGQMLKKYYMVDVHLHSSLFLFFFQKCVRHRFSSHIQFSRRIQIKRLIFFIFYMIA